MVVKPLCLTFLALAFKALLNSKEEEVRWLNAEVPKIRWLNAEVPKIRWLNAEVPKMQDTAYTHMPHMDIATLTQTYLN